MFVALYVISLAIMAIASVIVYVVRSLGEAYVFRVMGLKWWWIAWIPAINFLGFWGAYSVRTNDAYFRVGGAKVPGWLVGLWPVWRIVLRQIPFVGWLLALIVRVLCFGTECEAVYGMFDGERIGVLTNRGLGYLSGLLGVIQIWKFLMYRIGGRRPMGNNDNVVFEEWV